MRISFFFTWDMETNLTPIHHIWYTNECSQPHYGAWLQTFKRKWRHWHAHLYCVPPHCSGEVQHGDSSCHISLFTRGYGATAVVSFGDGLN